MSAQPTPCPTPTVTRRSRWPSYRRRRGTKRRKSSRSRRSRRHERGRVVRRGRRVDDTAHTRAALCVIRLVREPTAFGTIERGGLCEDRARFSRRRLSIAVCFRGRGGGFGRHSACYYWFVVLLLLLLLRTGAGGTSISQFGRARRSPLRSGFRPRSSCRWGSCCCGSRCRCGGFTGRWLLIGLSSNSGCIIR